MTGAVFDENVSISDFLHRMDLIRFRQDLLKWGKKNFRDFPWRQSHNPYRILLAETLLHRTRAEQVVQVYKQAIILFPTIQDLALADFSSVEQLLHPLGLHWRTELVYQMASEIVNKHGGDVPEELEKLLTLPGVSMYIASAVRCFSWGHNDPLLDTNTIRIAGRIFNVRTSDSSRRDKKFKKILGELVDPDHPREFNYALLDLGALICTSRPDPLCHLCPLQNFCKFFERVDRNARDFHI